MGVFKVITLLSGRNRTAHVKQMSVCLSSSLAYNIGKTNVICVSSSLVHTRVKQMSVCLSSSLAYNIGKTNVISVFSSPAQTNVICVSSSLFHTRVKHMLACISLPAHSM